MKKNIFCFLLAAFTLSILFSCGSDNESNNITNPWKDNPYKLNVIYFVPNDVDTIPNYRKRLSNIMLNLQKFYGDNIKRAGYGHKSFGLDLLSDTKVNIITIKGEKGKSSYSYDSGSDAISAEIDKYFLLHPASKKSVYSLIITPSYSADPNNPGGPPFYGIGTLCYALDYPGMDVDKLGTAGISGDLATKWIGGIAHELGHGLNFPHDIEHKSEKPILGTALMGEGNYSFGKTPTFITNAEAAVFSTSQTFSEGSKSNWYAPVQNNIQQLKGEIINNTIVITGKYTSSLPVSVINVYHDPYPVGDNDDYDALAWTTKPLAGQSFRFECPISEFYTLSGNYELRLEFYHDNGTLVTHTAQYQFMNGVPNISSINMKH